MTVAAAPAAAASQRPLFVAGLGAALLMAALVQPLGVRIGTLFGIGVGLGYVLSWSRFGFAGGYRQLLVHGETTGVRAQVLLLALTTALFAPILLAGSADGAAAPLSPGLLFGAILFGACMQLGGGCGSGTLFALGNGNWRLAVTLAGFCAGSWWATLDAGWWGGLPDLGYVVLSDRFGWAAPVAQTVLLLAVWRALARWDPQRGRGWTRLATGAVLLAIGNAATLLVGGRPWSITWAYALWGAKLAAAMGWSPAGSSYWSAPGPAGALAGPVLGDAISVMDIGVLIGALLAATRGGRFGRSAASLAWRPLAAALLGGVGMGYGARLSLGCNIGAMVDGIATTSLSGWIWLACALAGCWLGIRLRGLFGLADG